MLYLLLSIKVVKESERLLVFRLGRFFRTKGLGLIIVIPLVHKLERVNLNEKIPAWQTLSEEELKKKIKAFALYKS